jgi:predicted RNA-binding protein with PUA-like domain
MAHWILKTEPTTYSYADLVREQRTRWDGVANPVAIRHLKAMRPGDDVMIYHTGKEKAVVGLARVVAGDPNGGLVELEAGRALRRPVTLAEIKADAAFAELALVRQGRLSVVPVPRPQWDRLLKISGA